MQKANRKQKDLNSSMKHKAVLKEARTDWAYIHTHTLSTRNTVRELNTPKLNQGNETQLK